MSPATKSRASELKVPRPAERHAGPPRLAELKTGRRVYEILPPSSRPSRTLPPHPVAGLSRTQCIRRAPATAYAARGEAFGIWLIRNVEGGSRRYRSDEGRIRPGALCRPLAC